MNSHPNPKLAIPVAVGLVALLALSGYALTRLNTKDDTQIAVSTTPTPTPTVAPTASPTAIASASPSATPTVTTVPNIATTWKNETSAQGKFSYKVPTGYTLEKQVSGWTPSEINPAWIQLTKEEKTTNCPDKNFSCTANYFASVRVWNSTLSALSGQFQGGFPDVSTWQDVIIGGVSGKMSDYGRQTHGETTRQAYVESNGFTYEFVFQAGAFNSLNDTKEQYDNESPVFAAFMSSITFK